jgi:hypothetical protein
VLPSIVAHGQRGTACADGFDLIELQETLNPLIAQREEDKVKRPVDLLG